MPRPKRAGKEEKQPSEKSRRSTFIWLVAVSLAMARPASILPLGPTAGVATLPAGPLLLRRFCGFILAEGAQAEAVVGEGEVKGKELRLTLPSRFAACCLLKCKCDESIEFISHTNTHRHTQTHTQSHIYSYTLTHTHTDTDYILRLS